MDNLLLKITASVITAVLLCIGTNKGVGAMQQSGYKNASFYRWLTRKDNLFFNRIAVLALCLALASAVTSLCFSFLGTMGGLLCSAIPFLTLCFAFVWAESKYALKVPYKRTARFNRLFVAYLLLTAGAAFGIIVLLSYLAKWNGSSLYGLIAYVPVAILPVCLPYILCLANGILSVFENAKNKKFVKRAGQVLNETQIIRIGIVGSYGKTSVKNILKTLLSEKYSVVETPESYNTPIGIAKTVFSDNFNGKEIFIAEMGARRKGDISTLCDMVKPDYAIFTGVCAQHVQTFGSLENIYAEKSTILQSTAKKVVCGKGLREHITETDGVIYANEVKEATMSSTNTKFTLSVCGEDVAVKTSLLGEGNAENISLCVRLCEELGMTREEIERGLSKITPVPHRLQLLENNGVYILDDGYNCNPRGAKQALAALTRFDRRKCIVTPGIVECGILEESINNQLGADIAAANLDKVILVGDTLVGAVKEGYLNADGAAEKLFTVKTLALAQEELSKWISAGDAVLFLNDLPDVY